MFYATPPIAVLALAVILAMPVSAQVQAQTQPAPYRPAPVPQGAPPAAQAAPQPAPGAQAPAIQQIDTARQLWRDNKLLQALDALDAAQVSITHQLGQTYAPTLPPPPQGWTVEPPNAHRAEALGGGVAAFRDYRQAAGAAPPAPPPGQPAGQPPQGQGQMNARIVVDSSAVQSMQPLFGPQMPQGVPPTVRKVRINDQDAVVAFDPQRRAGEVSVILGNRLLLQVEGQNVASAEPMLAVMRQWNIPDLRRRAGM